MQLLPFNFAQLSNGNIFISGQSGSFTFLKNYEQLEDLISHNFDSLGGSQLFSLIANNFISHDDELSIRATLIASNLATQIRSVLVAPSLFMIVPTLRCDHDCGYCQVSRVPKNTSGFDSDIGQIEKILSIIGQTQQKEIKIEFQGGEPLLYFEYIKMFYELAQAEMLGGSIEYVICTAAGPLDGSILEWARDKEVSFSISLDGPEIVHNTNRPSKYFNPFAVTEKSIRTIQSTLGTSRVGCLATVSKYSLGFPLEIVESYRNLGLDRIFLRPLSPFGFALKTQSKHGYTVKDFMLFYKQALSRILDINRDVIFVEEMALIHLRKLFQPLKNGYIDLQSPSGYVFGALVFNYDGKVFGADEARMLWQSTGANELVLADLSKEESVDWRANTATTHILQSSFACASPGCCDCAYLPFCGSDPLHHLATQGESVGDKSISFFCEFQKAFYDYLLVLWQEDIEAKRVFERWLSL